ncbi:hypothetical protein C0J52_15512 [Blattella germanica]|nr:hypothetical protein C0J52_15512 [Blattella germanica]
MKTNLLLLYEASKWKRSQVQFLTFFTYIYHYLNNEELFDYILTFTNKIGLFMLNSHIESCRFK